MIDIHRLALMEADGIAYHLSILQNVGHTCNIVIALQRHDYTLLRSNITVELCTKLLKPCNTLLMSVNLIPDRCGIELCTRADHRHAQ